MVTLRGGDYYSETFLNILMYDARSSWFKHKHMDSGTCSSIFLCNNTFNQCDL